MRLHRAGETPRLAHQHAGHALRAMLRPACAVGDGQPLVRAARPAPATPREYPARGEVPGLPVRNRCLVMGIVNVTPDSFSDGGRYLQTAGAVEHGMALVAAGADIVDVGGESTRPGARPVPVDVELHRVVPVVRELARAGTTVSIDTMHAEVARAALAAGALAVNDVSGGLADPAMAGLVADAQVPYVAMHWRAPSVDMQRHARYGDVVAEVAEELSRRLDAFVEAGMDPRRIVLDPGLGFAKNAAHNWQLLARFDELLALGHPILVGASRKSFLGALLATDDGPAAPDARDVATAAVSALAAAAGAYCVRVHDVRSTLDAVRVATAWADVGRAAGRPGPPEAHTG
jgi:dihydropteroate synthase